MDREQVFVSWPPKGYVLAPVVYNRWSLSVPAANFANATVTMTDNEGLAVTLNIVSNIPTMVTETTPLSGNRRR